MRRFCCGFTQALHAPLLPGVRDACCGNIPTYRLCVCVYGCVGWDRVPPAPPVVCKPSGPGAPMGSASSAAVWLLEGRSYVLVLLPGKSPDSVPRVSRLGVEKRRRSAGLSLLYYRNVCPSSGGSVVTLVSPESCGLFGLINIWSVQNQSSVFASGSLHTVFVCCK